MLVSKREIYSKLLIFIENASFNMDPDSLINTTARGQSKGLGFQEGDGASYGGQGGSQTEGSFADVTYGGFSQAPNTQKDHKNQQGSGGGSENRRGGGVIIIIADNALIEGRLIADGSPSITQAVLTSYHAGSGGYVYVRCTNAM